MAAQATVTLNTKPYNPGQPLGAGIPAWYDRSSDVLTGFGVLSQNIRQNGNGEALRIEFKLRMPTVATEDSTCACDGTVLHETYATVVFQIANKSSLAERTDFYLRMKDLLANAVVQNAVENGEGSW